MAALQPDFPTRRPELRQFERDMSPAPESSPPSNPNDGLGPGYADFPPKPPCASFFTPQLSPDPYGVEKVATVTAIRRQWRAEWRRLGSGRPAICAYPIPTSVSRDAYQERGLLLHLVSLRKQRRLITQDSNQSEAPSRPGSNDTMWPHCRGGEITTICVTWMTQLIASGGALRPHPRQCNGENHEN